MKTFWWCEDESDFADKQMDAVTDLVAVMREQKTKANQQARLALAVKLMEMTPLRHQDGVRFFNSADIDANHEKIEEVMMPLVRAVYRSTERINLYKVRHHMARSLVKFIMKWAGMPLRWSQARLGPTLPGGVYRFVVPQP